MGSVLSANIAEFGPANTVAAAALLVLAGLVYCFVGYRVFHVLLGVTGFMLAGPVAAALVGWVAQGRMVFMALGMVLGGIAGAVALCLIYRLGVFFLGLLGAVAVAHSVLLGRSDLWVTWVLIGAGLLGGLLALWLERPAMTVATAAIGAWTVVHSALFLAGAAGLQDTLENPAYEPALVWGILGFWAVLGILGVLTQFLVFKPRSERS